MAPKWIVDGALRRDATLYFTMPGAAKEQRISLFAVAATAGCFAGDTRLWQGIEYEPLDGSNDDYLTQVDANCALVLSSFDSQHLAGAFGGSILEATTQTPAALSLQFDIAMKP